MSSLHRKVNEFKTLYGAFHMLHREQNLTGSLTAQEVKLKRYNNNMFNIDEMFMILIHPINMDVILHIYLRYLDKDIIYIILSEKPELEREVLDRFIRNIKYHRNSLVMKIQTYYTMLKKEGKYDGNE